MVMEVLLKLYPEAWPDIPMSEMKETSTDKKVAFIWKAFKCINESWNRNHMWMDSDVKTSNTNVDVDQLVLGTLECLVKAARELFDVPEQVLRKDHGSILKHCKNLSRSEIISEKECRQDISKNTEVSVSATNENASEKCNGTDIQGTTLPPIMQIEGSVSTFLPLKKGPGPLPPPPSPPLPPATGMAPLKRSPCPPPPPPPSPPLSNSMPSKGVMQSTMSLKVGPNLPPAPPPPAPTAIHLKGAVPMITSEKKAPASCPPPPAPAPMIMTSKGAVTSTKPPITAPGPPPPPVPPSVKPSDKALPQKMNPGPPPPPAVPRSMPQKIVPSPPPPLPSIGAGRLQLPRKPSSKLKRSTQMANLFQELKRKMNESVLSVKSTNKKRMQLGGHTGGKQGMGASIAELTRRSTYFQQIEENVRVYRKSILDLQAAINSFQTNDMVKLLKFQNNVESILEVLSDESQVLAKFEGFPTKKLETLRTAAALCSKFETMITTLKDWEVKPPLGQHLDKIECYLKKIKQDLDAFERSKDEQSKKFKSHNIEFDFVMVTRIKEAMVDLSSSCMELAIREIRETKTAGDNQGALNRTNQKKEESVKMLWRVFQLAFRAYSFAGGQDDHANVLAKELADEILGKSPNQ